MTRDSDSAKSVNYIIKAENSLRIAKIAAEQGAYDNAVMSAIHSAINALDALTSFHLNKRSSGAHSSVFSLIKGILADRDYKDVERQFKLLLSLKNVSEYQPILMSLKDAQDSIKSAERILAKVKAKTTLDIIKKLEKIGIIKKTAGKTAMYQLNLLSPITKSIKKLAFEIASKRINKILAKR